MKITRQIVLCVGLSALATSAFSQTPTSGALLTIKGMVNGVAVNRSIYDSQIHTGVVQAVPPCGLADQIPTDAYVLQGGSATGCDPGDAFETAQGTGTATISGTGYSFGITTQYLMNNGDVTYCTANVSPSICANPDTGFLTITNNSGADFNGSITLTGKAVNPNLFPGSGYCAVDGVASVNLSSGTLGAGSSATFALSTDSSNCGGWNAAQTLNLVAGAESSASFGKDDYKITPLNSAAGDTLDVLPVPVPAGPLGLNTWGVGNFGTETPFFSPLRFSAGTHFAPTTYACIPYADFSAPNNPVCVEFQLTPHGTSGGNYLYTATNDFNIDANSLPNGVGGPSFLGHHLVNCPDSGFDINTFFSYTAPSNTFGDPIKTSGGGTGSCWVAAFDPNVAAIPTGTTFSSFVGFQTPVSDTDLNIVKAGSAVPLIWQQFISPGVPVTNLNWCPGPTVPTTSVCASKPALPTPWVFIGTLKTDCMVDDSPNTEPDVPAGGSGLQNFGNGTYQFNWKTVKGSTGCADVVLIYDSGLTLFPAQFKYK